MANEKNSKSGGSEVVTIGAVKAPVKVWGMINTYKTRERQSGRKLNTREAMLELAERGAIAEGIK